MITVSPAQCRAAGMTIGLATGEKKALSIIAAARARMISALVTDVRTAEAILQRLT
jgi:DNA-binding transcriptional regulator LsrR (DeoR family)